MDYELLFVSEISRAGAQRGPKGGAVCPPKLRPRRSPGSREGYLRAKLYRNPPVVVFFWCSHATYGMPNATRVLVASWGSHGPWAGSPKNPAKCPKCPLAKIYHP